MLCLLDNGNVNTKEHVTVDYFNIKQTMSDGAHLAFNWLFVSFQSVIKRSLVTYVGWGGGGHLAFTEVLCQHNFSP